MNYDEILERHLGETGIFFTGNILLLWLPAIAAGMIVLQTSFTALAPPEYRCIMEDCESASTAAYLDYDAAFIHPLDGGELDYCNNYPPVSPAQENQTCPNQQDAFDSTGQLLKCDGASAYVYPEFEFESSLVTEIDLVCGEEYKVALISSIYMSGMIAGSFIGGRSMDWIGRKWALMMFIVIGGVGGLANAFVNNYALFCVCRFVAAMGHTGLFLVPFTTSVELVGTKMVTFWSNMSHVPFALGQFVVIMIAYGERDWRTFQIYSSVPIFCLLLLYFITPESPRWLIANKRYGEARDVVAKAAKINKKHVPEEVLKMPEEAKDYGSIKAEKSESTQTLSGSGEERFGFKSLFDTRVMRKHSFIMFFNWMVVALSYYGISYSAGSIGDDLFVSNILIALVEVPACIICALTMDRLGRKPLMVFAMAFLGVFCVAAGFIPEGDFRTLFMLFGKFGASAGFSIVYQFTAELYPSEIRGTGMGMCSMFGRFGGIAAPQITLYLPLVTNDALPLLLIGIMALCSCAITLLLPETLGVPLVESIDEVENLYVRTKPFFAWWSRAQLKESVEKNMLLIARKRESPPP